MDNNGYIAPATAEKLQGSFPLGTRHKAKVDIAVSLIGNGMSPQAVFTELQSKFPEAKDREIESVIDWVVKQNPQPTGFQSNGDSPRKFQRSYQNSYREPPKRTPAEQCEWWTSGSRTTPEQLTSTSPVQIPESESAQAALAFSCLYQDQDVINIVCDYTEDEKRGKANPVGAGKVLTRDDWLIWFNIQGVPASNAGAWVRINPCTPLPTGKNGAVTNDDITNFRFLLIEWDRIALPIQIALIQRLRLPIAAVILSGGGSAHAWVRMESIDDKKYKEDAQRILDALGPFGVDQQNKNCSRLCRLPGAKRVIKSTGDGIQRLLWLNPNVSVMTDETIKRFEESLIFPAIEEKPMRSIALKAIDRYEEMRKNVGKLGVPYGIDQLDAISGGMKPGQTIVVAGETGGGKSTLGLHMIDSALKRGLGVLLFSLEMDREEIFDLFMSNRCGVDRNKFNTGAFSDNDISLMAEGIKDISQLPLYIEDSAMTSADQVELLVNQLNADKKIGLVVVDYIQFVNPELTARDVREQQVAAISHKLRAVARKTKLPMVILSQLNDEGRLRESRVIAHNANVVMVVEAKEENNETFMVVKVVKGRGIPTGEYKLEFRRRFARLISEPVPTSQQFEVPLPYKDR